MQTHLGGKALTHFFSLSLTIPQEKWPQRAEQKPLGHLYLGATRATVRTLTQVKARIVLMEGFMHVM